MSTGKSATAESGNGIDDLGVLRRLLQSPEQRRLEELAERLEDRQQRVDDVSQVLPEALRRSAERGDALNDALTPTVENIIHASVRRDSRHFADALFPVIGPAIRKAMAETLRQMLQNLSEVLEHSFSRRGLAWRFEAWRTGRPFAEVVLLHSLEFRVEQVFLIHRESGVLLQHLRASNIAFEDADLVSAMLTAIQDFVHDSFAMADDQALDSIQMGDLTVWVEQGPEAVIAGAIRGNAPAELRDSFREALETIHQQQADALRQFDGDPTPFEADDVQQTLQACLQSRYRERPKRISPLVIAILLTLGAAAGYWFYTDWREQQAFDNYVQRLDQTPGIVVTSATTNDGGYQIHGLRDPLAAEPATLRAKKGPLSAQHIELRFEPYQALVPDFVLTRAKRLLQPPATANLSLADGVLHLTGKASADWIAGARRLALALPGITRIDDSALQNQSAITLKRLREELNRQVILFNIDTARGEADAQTLQRLARDLKQLHALAQNLGQILQITLVGHSDATGTAARNKQLSHNRAQWLREQLQTLGVNPALLQIRAAGSSEPEGNEDTPQGQARNRSVTLEIHLTPMGESDA